MPGRAKQPSAAIPLIISHIAENNGKRKGAGIKEDNRKRVT